MFNNSPLKVRLSRQIFTKTTQKKYVILNTFQKNGERGKELTSTHKSLKLVFARGQEADKIAG